MCRLTTNRAIAAADGTVLATLILCDDDRCITRAGIFTQPVHLAVEVPGRRPGITVPDPPPQPWQSDRFAAPQPAPSGPTCRELVWKDYKSIPDECGYPLISGRWCGRHDNPQDDPNPPTQGPLS